MKAGTNRLTGSYTYIYLSKKHVATLFSASAGKKPVGILKPARVNAFTMLRAFVESTLIMLHVSVAQAC
jgi:hypothetical protein